MSFTPIWSLSEIKQDKDVNVFTIFSCGGGSSMGYKRAGFKVIGNCEIDPKMNEIYLKNNHPKYNYNMDVRDFLAKEDLPEELYNLDILDGSPPCFVAGTLVKTQKGHKNIEDIKIGDYVLTHAGIYNKVIGTMVKEVDGYCAVRAGEEIFFVTENHPFLVINSDGYIGWKAVRDINEEEDRLIGYDKNNEMHFYRMQKGIIRKTTLVYNLSVEKNESYTVGKNNIIVHNCSLFSMAGIREKGWGKEKAFREGQKKQTLDDLFFVFLDVVEKLRPKVVVAENVKGLILGNARKYVNEIIKRFKELGYDVQIFLLNAAFMNVPQRRERVFFIANRMGYGKLNLQFNEKIIKYGEIKSGKGEPFPEDFKAEKYAKMARSGDSSVSDIKKRMGHKEGNYGYIFVWDDEVPPTMTHEPFLRGGQLEKVSKEDVRRIQTFPEDYDFVNNSLSNVNYVCGMSVPPNMMANIATEIWKQWLSKEKKGK